MVPRTRNNWCRVGLASTDGGEGGADPTSFRGAAHDCNEGLGCPARDERGEVTSATDAAHPDALAARPDPYR